jgi:hypothetical protein
MVRMAINLAITRTLPVNNLTYTLTYLTILYSLHPRAPRAQQLDMYYVPTSYHISYTYLGRGNP